MSTTKVDTDRKPTEQEMHVLRAYGWRDVPVGRIADVQSLTIEQVEAIITAWAHDDREQAKVVISHYDGNEPMPPKKARVPKAKPPTTAPAKKEVPVPVAELQDAAVAAAVEATPAVVPDEAPPPEGAEVFEALTGSQVLALVHDAGNSPNLSTRQVGRRIQVLVAELSQVLDGERAAEEERAAREEIAAAVRARVTALEIELSRLRKGALFELVREWALLNGWTPPEGELPVELVRAYFQAQSRGPSWNGS